MIVGLDHRTAGLRPSEARAGSDDERPVRAGQNLAKRLDDLAVVPSVLPQVGEVMVGGRVDDVVGRLCGRSFTSPRKTSARAWASASAPASERLSPTTWWPALMSSGTRKEPMKPVAPVRNTRILHLYETTRHSGAMRIARCSELVALVPRQ